MFRDNSLELIFNGYANIIGLYLRKKTPLNISRLNYVSQGKQGVSYCGTQNNGRGEKEEGIRNLGLRLVHDRRTVQ